MVVARIYTQSSPDMFVDSTALKRVEVGIDDIDDYCNIRSFSRDLTIPHLDLSHFALCNMGN